MRLPMSLLALVMTVPTVVACAAGFNRAEGPGPGSRFIELRWDADPEPVPATVSRPRAMVPTGRHVLIIGDSEACAVGAEAQETVRSLNDELAQPYDTVEVECKVSSRVEHWNTRLGEALDRRPYVDAVIVFLGTNHYADKNPPRVSAILDRIQERGAACVWVGNTAVRGRSWPINNALSEAVGSTCGYFNAEAAGIALVDGVHPTRRGAREWLRAVWTTLPTKYKELDE